MRFVPMAIGVWLSLLQVPSAEALAPESAAGLLAALATLAGLGVMIYRLGGWRQEMFHTKHNVGAEVSRLREENTSAFAGVHRRLDAIDRRLDTAAEQRVAGERWRARVDTTLAGHDRELAGIGQRMTRVETAPHMEAP